MYTNLQYIIDVFGEEQVKSQLGVDDDGNILTPALTRAIEAAGAEIDSYIGVRYPLPLPTIPAIIKQCAIDMAWYKVSVSLAFGLSEEKRKRYEDAIKILKDIGKGFASLNLPTPAGEEESPQASFVSGPDRYFTRDKMWGL